LHKQGAKTDIQINKRITEIKFSIHKKEHFNYKMMHKKETSRTHKKGRKLN